MNEIEKRINYVINEINDDAVLGDRDDLTKDGIYKFLAIDENNALEELTDAKNSLLDTFDKIVEESYKLVQDDYYYNNEQREKVYDIVKRKNSIIMNRKINSTSIDKTIENIVTIVDIIKRYRFELAEILTVIKDHRVKKSTRKGKGLFEVLIDLLLSGNEKKKREEKEEIEEMIENSYLDDLEKEMVRKGEFIPLEYEDDIYDDGEEHDD